MTKEYSAPVEYLPHEPPMVLIDKVLYVDNDKAVCECYVNYDGVLKPFLNDQGQLPSFYCMELLAQSIGVWSGFLSKENGQDIPSVGMVIGCRGIKSKDTLYPSGSTLNITVDKVLEDNALASFDGIIEIDGEVFSKGRVTVIEVTDEQKHELFKRNN